MSSSQHAHVMTSLQVPLSEGERQFVAEGVALGIRADGRGVYDSRDCSIEVGVIPTASGSAHVTVDGTQVLATVKAQILTITEEQRRGGPDAIRDLLQHPCSVSLSSGVEVLASKETADGFKTMLEMQIETLPYVELVKQKLYWVFAVDVLVERASGGGVLSVMSYAVKSALHNARVPEVLGVAQESSPEYEIKVTSDAYDVHSIDHSSIPVFVAFAKVADTLVCDPTLEEETCMNSVLTVAVDQQGHVSGAKQDGMGGVAPKTLCQMFNHAQQAGVAIVNKIVASNEQEEANRQIFMDATA